MKGIYCAGEEGRVVLDILRRSTDDAEIVFLDDDESLWGEEVLGHDVVGGKEKLTELDPEQMDVIVAFAAGCSIRLDIADRVQNAGFDFFSVIDPDSTVSSSATLGEGVIVNAQSYIGPNATVEDSVDIDSAVNISHDVQLSEGVIVGPNATIAGGADVGRGTFVGAGSTISDHVTVGEQAVVGAGAVVISDVPPGQTVIGVPAEPISR